MVIPCFYCHEQLCFHYWLLGPLDECEDWRLKPIIGFHILVTSTHIIIVQGPPKFLFICYGHYLSSPAGSNQFFPSLGGCHYFSSWMVIPCFCWWANNWVSIFWCHLCYPSLSGTCHCESLSLSSSFHHTIYIFVTIDSLHDIPSIAWFIL